MLILGSASPRRRQLLARLGIPFEVQTTPADEDVVTTADPAANVLARARLKGAALQAELTAAAGGDGLLLTADTVVAIDGRILNKPADPDEARAMLARLCGHWHQVLTAVVVNQLAPGGLSAERVVQTEVAMRPYTDEEIESYIASGDPFDKAGGYAIQHPDFRPVAALAGCYTTVVGLPLCHTAELLRQLQPELTMNTGDLTGRTWSGCRFCQAEFTPLPAA